MPQPDEQPEDQPDQGRPAGPPDPSRQRTDPPAEAEPHPEEPVTVADPAPVTVENPTRWTGSAAVTRPSKKRKRRSLNEDATPIPDEDGIAVPPQRREPTLELPAAERPAPEDLPAVDPWADHPLPTHAVPPALPYPAPGPQPPAVPPATPPKPRQPRADERPGKGAPPGWRPPSGHPVVRRRRWPWVLLVTTLVTVGCCCGLPAYVLKPMSEQYPAKADLPDQVGNLRLRDDAESRALAQRIEARARMDHPFADGTFAGVYETPTGKDVTVFGSTGFRWSPDKDLDAELSRLTPRYQLSGLRQITTGTRGEFLSCGTGRVDGTDVVACTWVDHGSVGTALFTRLSVDDSADQITKLRERLLTRG